MDEPKAALSTEGWEFRSEGVRTLPVPLTEAQMSEMGHDLGVLTATIAQDEENRRSVMKDLKAGIDAKRASANELAGFLERRQRNEQVPVRTEVSFAENLARVVRLDTSEIVETRALTTEERNKLAQGSLVAGQDDAPKSVRRRRKSADDELPPEAGDDEVIDASSPPMDA